MYMICKIKGIVRIPADKLGEDLEDTAKEILRNEYEGRFIKDLGYVLSIFDVKVSKFGKILQGDGASYHVTKFSALTYMPYDKEVVEGEIIDVKSFGLIMRSGPLEGLIHISQVMDDRVNVDVRRALCIGEKTKRTIGKGDRVRARIVSISISGSSVKVGLTMRQPFLGKIDWIKEDVEKLKGTKKEVKTVG